MSNHHLKCTKDEIKINNSPPSTPPPEKVYKYTTSKYHINCTKDEIKINNSSPSTPPPPEKAYGHNLTSKYHVKCTEDEFQKKKPVPLPPTPPSPPPESIQIQKRSSLLDVLTKDRDCACEVVARAVRSHVHMNLGLQEKREEINGVRKRSTEKMSSSKEP